jgi:3-methylcrotonyl-CoA carboxylase alpha subunit
VDAAAAMSANRLRRCLIANRGEIALRIMRACRELGMEAAAVYSDADAGALHVRRADAAFHLGAAAPAESYLHTGRLIDAARALGCDAVHPGYGFLSEAPAFAAAVIDAGLTWVGPAPDAIAAMGDKIDARRRMIAAGVPVAPGFDAPIDAPLDDLRAQAARVGFPLMVKAAGGGGGRGIRVVHTPDALAEALESARREADHAFGDPRLFVERYIERGRHIEVQVVADADGNTVHLGERECSAQRRHQKVIEESPSPLVNDALRGQLGAAAVEAARAVGYLNAGTVEFIMTPDGTFYFLEMNTRLQVEHPVTEWVTGVDLVRMQFAIASGEPLPFAQPPALRGHAVECRLYAENPRRDFLPDAGRLLRFTPPTLPGVRVDAGVESGDTIPIHYDPLIAKIIAHDATRSGAIRRLELALRELIVLGVTTNRDFLRALLRHPAFAAGEVDTGFIEAHLAELTADSSASDAAFDRALIAAALHDSAAPAAGGRVIILDESPWARADGWRL